MIVYLIIGLYLFLTFGISLLTTGKQENNPEGYFLAGRNMGPVVLFFTFIATNFSAFFFLGFAGAGYRIGLPFYTMMSFGTAFTALSFYFIGSKVWALGKSKGYITPPELIRKESGSSVLGNLYLSVLFVFTLPYLALQPIGAGILLERLTEGGIPYFMGAILLSFFICLYVLFGGMKSVALTDVKQGILMFVLMFTALFVIAGKFGGITQANEMVFQIKPALFSRGGNGSFFTEQKWFSNMILWILCVPIIPQLFMRFYISKNISALKSSTILYAIVPLFLFICPVLIGMMGHLSFPDLQGKAADQILPMMLNAHSPKWLAALIMTGALAAFMSTLDSQLLSLGTMFTRDFYKVYINPKIGLESEVRIGKMAIIVFALVGLGLAYKPPESIFALAKLAFTGYAILFPTTIAVLYLKKKLPIYCILSIIIGLILLIALFLDVIQSDFFFGFDMVVPIFLSTSFTIILGILIDKSPENEF